MDGEGVTDGPALPIPPWHEGRFSDAKLKKHSPGWWLVKRFVNQIDISDDQVIDGAKDLDEEISGIVESILETLGNIDMPPEIREEVDRITAMNGHAVIAQILFETAYPCEVCAWN